MYFNNGSEILNNVDSIVNHFKINGSPIMIGGSVLAYTLLAISIVDDKPDET